MSMCVVVIRNGRVKSERWSAVRMMKAKWMSRLRGERA